MSSALLESGPSWPWLRWDASGVPRGCWGGGKGDRKAVLGATGCCWCCSRRPNGGGGDTNTTGAGATGLRVVAHGCGGPGGGAASCVRWSVLRADALKKETLQRTWAWAAGSGAAGGMKGESAALGDACCALPPARPSAGLSSADSRGCDAGENRLLAWTRNTGRGVCKDARRAELAATRARDGAERARTRPYTPRAAPVSSDVTTREFPAGGGAPAPWPAFMVDTRLANGADNDTSSVC